MGKRALWIFLAAVGVSVGLGLWAEGRETRETELSAREEFAVWPVDTIIEAKTECIGGEEWRRSAEETATTFAREVLILERINLGDFRRFDDDEGAISVSEGRSLWSTGLGLREAYGCWYVTGVSYEDDYSSGDPVAYAGSPPNQVLFLPIGDPAGYTGGPVFVRGTLGSGFNTLDLDIRIDTGDPARNVMVSAASDLPGHYMYSYDSPEDDGSRSVNADTVPPPPDPAASVQVPPPSRIRDMLAEQLRLRNVGGCKRWWLGDEDPVRGALHYLWIAEPRGDGRRSHTDPVRAGKGDLSGTLDGVRVRFDFWRPTKGCSVLGRVTSVGSQPEGVRSVRVDDDAFFFDLDWGRATHASLEYSYGNNLGDHSVPPIRNPLGFNTYPPRDNTSGGYYFVTFYNGNRVLAVEGGALPPVEMIRDPASPELETNERKGTTRYGPRGRSRGYKFFDVRVDYLRGTKGEVDRDVAEVTAEVRWEYTTFPGRRHCWVGVFNSDGDPIGQREIRNFTAREQGSQTMRVRITGKPNTAHIACHPNYKDERTPTVRVADTDIIPHGRLTTRLTFVAKWMGPGEPSTAECLATFYDRHIRVAFRSRFDIAVEEESDRFGINLPNESPELEDPKRALVTCHPKKPGARELPTAEPGVVVN